ncbi:MAG TPA: hypothetical protein VMM13_11265 [Euzebya sp.]|nr:hypothetical protein [Euzebya sp.]
MTGREELTHFAHLHAGPHRDVSDLLGALGLAEAADQPVGSYSKGMRVRLNLALVLLHDPVCCSSTSRPPDWTRSTLRPFASTSGPSRDGGGRSS